MTLRNAVLAALTAVALSAAGGLAHAQSCPADLSNLQGQITSPSLQVLLTAPIDQMIANGGGLTQTLTQSQQSLTNIKAEIAHLPPESTGAAVTLNEAVVVLNALISSLNCRINAQAH